MKTFWKILFVLSILTYTLTSLYNHFWGLFNPENPKYVSLCNTITDEFIDRECKRHGLKFLGGGGGFLDRINKIELTFVLEKNVSVEEARELILSLGDDLLELINSDEDIRPYLSHYPFSPKGLCITVLFLDKQGRFVNQKHVANVSSNNGALFFYNFNQTENELITLKKETYKQAKLITAKREV